VSNGFTFDASYGGVRIDVVSSSIAHGRKLTAHGRAKRDGARLEDSGRQPWVCDLDFLFIDRRLQEGESEAPAPALERFAEFDRLVSKGIVRRLVHPYSPSRLCRISNFVHAADGEGQPTIRCSATFTEEMNEVPVFEAASSLRATGGVHQLKTVIVRARAALDSADLAPSELAEANAELDTLEDTASAWESDPTVSARDVHLQMATSNNTVGARLESLDCARRLERWLIVKEYTALQYWTRVAAEAFTAETRRVVTLTTHVPMPLRIIAARFYGAREAEDRMHELLELNPELRTPALVDAGIEIRAYAQESEPGA